MLKGRSQSGRDNSWRLIVGLNFTSSWCFVFFFQALLRCFVLTKVLGVVVVFLIVSSAAKTDTKCFLVRMLT